MIGVLALSFILLVNVIIKFVKDGKEKKPAPTTIRKAPVKKAPVKRVVKQPVKKTTI
jgi:hypothetical protein